MTPAIHLLSRLGKAAASPWERDPPLSDTLSSVDAQVRNSGCLQAVIEALEASKQPVFRRLRKYFSSTAVSQALTLKILNLCLAKYHFLSRGTRLLSQPFGLIADPSNSCNLACPGCVHSSNVRQRKLFDWNPGLMPEHRQNQFLRRFGPSALHITLCNYGEPLVNPNTPRFIRSAKKYLMRTMLSTSLSVLHFDAEAYVDSGLDSMVVSIDGATQAVYAKFRRKGNLDLVHRNLRKLVAAKRKRDARTPIITWHYLAFDHNALEIPAALDQARDMGVDQFKILTPFDVTWDDPEIEPAAVEQASADFDTDRRGALVSNWNPFPGEIDADAIEHEFELGWKASAGRALSTERKPAVTGATCHWLYKSITMDAGGRIFPCCASPRPDADLMFAQFGADAEPFNSPKYNLARLSFRDPEAYRMELDASGAAQEPYCAKCEWDKTAPNTSAAEIKQYFQTTTGAEAFDTRSLEILSAW